MARTDDNPPDEQDQSEVFDEANLDANSPGAPDNDFTTLEEIPDVLDVTRTVGDADEDEDEEDDDSSEAMSLDDEQDPNAIEAEADALLGRASDEFTAVDDETNGGGAAAEVELVYTGLMRNVKGAQASAAHWEARRLSDDDIEDLGYADERGPAT